MNRQLLDKIKAIVPLSQAEEESLKDYWKEKTLKKGERLLTNGAVCRTDNYVVEGALKAYYINSETGSEEILFLP